MSDDEIKDGENFEDEGQGPTDELLRKGKSNLGEDDDFADDLGDDDIVGGTDEDFDSLDKLADEELDDELDTDEDVDKW